MATASAASADIVPGVCTFQECVYGDSGDTSTIGVTDAALAGVYSATFGTSSASVDLTDVYLQEVLSGGGFGTRYDFAPSGTNTGAIEQYFIDGLQLAAGQYQFIARGTRTGEAGSVAGTLTITDNNAVPEPGTWMMMLMGFGAAGYSVRRGRRLKMLSQLA